MSSPRRRSPGASSARHLRIVAPPAAAPKAAAARDRAAPKAPPPRGPSAPKAARDAATLERAIAPTASLVREYVRCGKCGKRCKHGPYWYAYTYTTIYETGRRRPSRRKQYIGRELPAGLYDRQLRKLESRARWDPDAREAYELMTGKKYVDPYARRPARD